MDQCKQQRLEQRMVDPSLDNKENIAPNRFCMKDLQVDEKEAAHFYKQSLKRRWIKPTIKKTS